MSPVAADRPHPGVGHPAVVDGAQATDETGPRHLRQAGHDRRASLRPDQRCPPGEAFPATGVGCRPLRMEITRNHPQHLENVAHGCSDLLRRATGRATGPGPTDHASPQEAKPFARAPWLDSATGSSPFSCTTPYLVAGNRVQPSFPLGTEGGVLPIALVHPRCAVRHTPAAARNWEQSLHRASTPKPPRCAAVTGTRVRTRGGP